MNEFVYLYRRPIVPSGSPQQMQERMQRWRAWFAELESKGHLASQGQPLDNQGGAVVRDAKGSFSDGPYAETKDIVGGYSLIRARDLQEAVALTKGHPIFDMGGLIEVRAVAKIG
jgi:hypothetical protein